jgi:hypothetical protein
MAINQPLSIKTPLEKYPVRLDQTNVSFSKHRSLGQEFLSIFLKLETG